ncbi:MAG: glycosyltransferase [Solirubrobacterales bacterium]
MTAPKISVLLPVRDGERFLAETLESLRAQSLGDFELLAIDDGSGDRTAEILREAAARDPRLQVVGQGREGISAALNRGLALAKGELVARIDADDIARPSRFATQLAFLAAHPEVAAVGSDYEEIDAAGRTLRRVSLPAAPAEVRAWLPRSNCLAHPAVTMRRAAVLALGGYRRAFGRAQDYDLWLRLLDRWELANIAEPLLAYRRHATAASALGVAEQTFAELAARLAWERRAAGLPEGIDEARAIDRETLLAMGVSPAAVDRQLVKRFMAAARIAHRIGDRARAEALCREAAAFVPRGDLAARFDYGWRRFKMRR